MLMSPFEKVAYEAIALNLKDPVPPISSPIWWSSRGSEAEQRANNWDAISLFLPQSFLSIVAEHQFFGSKDVLVFSDSIVAYLESALGVNATKSNAEFFYRSLFLSNFVRCVGALSPSAFAVLSRDDLLMLRVSYRTTGYKGLVGVPRTVTEVLDLHLGEPSSHKSMLNLFGPILWRIACRLGISKKVGLEEQPVPMSPLVPAPHLSLVPSPKTIPVASIAIMDQPVERKLSAKEELAKAPDLKIETNPSSIRSVLLGGSGFCVAKIKTTGPSPSSCSIVGLFAASFDERGSAVRTLSLDVTSGTEKGNLREFFEFFGEKPVFVHHASLAARFLAPLRTAHGVVDRLAFYDSSVVAREAWPEARSDDEGLLAKLLGIPVGGPEGGLSDCLVVGRMLSLGARRVGLERGAFLGDTRPR